MASNGNFYQVAWVVDDLESAMDRWLDTTGVGPFFVIEHVPNENLLYRGEPAELDMSVAWAQAGAMQVELIQQHNDGPSAYRDSVPPGHSAMHHVGAITDDFDAETARYQAAGLAVPYESSSGGIRVAYFDTREAIGCMTELEERHPATDGLRAMIAEAADGWDGTDPIRRIPV